MNSKEFMEAAIVIIVVAIFGAATQIFWGPDNSAEEAAEQIIKNKTGVDVDLSPSTPELETKIPFRSDSPEQN